MIFPIGDTNVKGGSKPLFAYSLIVINVIVFILQIQVEGNFVCEYATVPSEIVKGHDLHTLISSMFLHGGWMHLVGNMLFLWVFADNIEAVVGNSRFIIFYILGGLFASGAHIALELIVGGDGSLSCCMPCAIGSNCSIEDSLCAGSIPSLGASGAISAVMGAYIVMFPKSAIKVLIFIWTVRVSALVFLGFWFVEQLMSGIGGLSVVSAQAAGVAWWAHIGGFIFGLAYGFLNRDITKGLNRINA
ncbi:MAG: rhomboid family intramembrane serine protease [Saprospiraceae bacterium]|nr:rhomboid family intramembrane serine protease [Saprospiraceae bacterium]